MNEAAFNDLSKAFASVAVSTEQASNAFRDFSACIPPFTEEDILRIKMNPSLSFISKIRIIRSMRKQMKGL